MPARSPGVACLGYRVFRLAVGRKMDEPGPSGVGTGVVAIGGGVVGTGVVATGGGVVGTGVVGGTVDGGAVTGASVGHSVGVTSGVSVGTTPAFETANTSRPPVPALPLILM